MTQKVPSAKKRCGSAAVEFAVILPLFVLLVLGAIDIGWALHVQHNLTEAARAGCRLYSVKVVPLAEVTDVIDKNMEDAGLDGYTVTYDPPTRTFNHLDAVKVTVSIPYDNVALFSSWFLPESTLEGNCIMPGDTSN